MSARGRGSCFSTNALASSEEAPFLPRTEPGPEREGRKVLMRQIYVPIDIGSYCPSYNLRPGRLGPGALAAVQDRQE